jgi:hypothetical protein
LDAVQLLLVLVVLAIVVAVVTAPLRRPPASPSGEEEEATADVAALEAAKEAKYREIRDAELDHRTGKLSDADWREIDRRLRAEAVEILRRLDEAGG